MVECSLSLDLIFGSLSHPTRRSILSQVAEKALSIGEIAARYKLTFAGVSKHVGVLEKAGLVWKRKEGKEHIVQLSPVAFKDASLFLQDYERLWNDRLDNLEAYLATLPRAHHKGKRPRHHR